MQQQIQQQATTKTSKTLAVDWWQQLQWGHTDSKQW